MCLSGLNNLGMCTRKQRMLLTAAGMVNLLVIYHMAGLSWWTPPWIERQQNSSGGSLLFGALGRENATDWRTSNHSHNNSKNNSNNNSSSSSNNRNPAYIVPNIVHFIRFGRAMANVSFVDMVCMKAAYLHIKPDQLIVHADYPPLGPYWEHLKNLSGVRVLHREKPKSVFGKPIQVVQHASDVARLQILAEHGGIYLDNDVFVVKPFDKFRTFNFTLGWPLDNKPDCLIGNQILISTKENEFLRRYYQSYRAFDDNRWYYNAGELPTTSILRQPGGKKLVNWQPDTVFAVATRWAGLIYQSHFNWTTFHAIHLLHSHRGYMVKDHYAKYHEYTPENIKRCDAPIGEMLRSIYYGNANMIS